MTRHKRIGIDTSKSVFTPRGIDQTEKPILRVNLGRAQLLPFFKRLPPTVIAMEARGGSHHRARALTALRHKVLPIPPRYVKPYVKRGKNDRNDAEAIREAAETQAQGMVLKVRETLVAQRTALINTLRGHAGEFGIVAGKGIGNVVPLEKIQAETAIPSEARETMALLGEEIGRLDTRLKEMEARLRSAHKANRVSQ